MTISDENVRPAIVVVVEKLRAKTEIGIADGSNPGRSGQVSEFAVVIVVIEIVVVVGKIGLHNVGPAVAIVVRRINAHAGLFMPIGTVRHARLGADFGKSTLAVVVVEQAWRRVVGYVKIEAAVFVVIQPQDSEPVVTFGVDAEFLGDIGESAVAVVVVQTIARAL